MKVMFLLDSLGAGGAERSTAVLLPALAQRGIDVSVVTLYTAEEGFEQEVRDAGVPVTVLRPGGLRPRVAELRSILRRERPDVLHTALYAADQIGRLAAIGLRTKVVSSWVNVPRTAEQRPAGVPRWKFATVNLIDATTGHLFVDRFHAVTPGVARLYTRAYRIPSRKVSVVERGRSTEAFGERTPDRRARVRAALGADAAAPVVVAAGRLEHQKAHVDLIRAMEQVVTVHPTAELWIAGRDGNASEAVHEALASSPAAGAVRLLGHRADVPDLLAAADVMALPSLFEGTAGIALEAMALGTPIVSTRLAGMDGILTDGANALLVDVGATAAMAAAIERLLADPALGDRLAAAARHDFDERFTLARSADRMAALYATVVSGRRAARS